MNKTQLQQEIAELKKQLEEKQKALAAMPEKWRPRSGKFYVDEDGHVSEIVSHLISNQDFGNQYSTREQAEKAAKAMRAHNRLLAYVAEFASSYEFCEGVGNWFVIFSHGDGGGFAVDYSYDLFLGAVYMPEYVARDLAAKLNSGEVEL